MSLRRIACEAAWLAAAWWLVGGSFVSARAQIGVFGEASPSTAPATIETVSSNAQRRLQQVETLLTGNAWEEAIDVLTELIAQPSAEFVGLPGELYVPLRTYCQMQLAQLPPEALALYRSRVDHVAAEWLQQGVADRDEDLLQRVTDELFCSSSGDEALMTLGGLALERGDTGAARNYWEAIYPGLRGPSGQPIDSFIRGLDLATQGQPVRDYLSSAPQPTSWLAYPDSDVPMNQILSRLTVASLRERNFDRAERELALLRLVDPQARGRLTGADVELVPALSEMLAAARTWPARISRDDWPTFAGNAARSRAATPLGRIGGARWEVPLAFRPTFASRRATLFVNGQAVRVSGPASDHAATATCFPLVYNGTVLFRDDDGIRAVSLDSSSPAITRDGKLHVDQQAGAAPPEDLVQQLRVFGGAVRSGSRVLQRPRTMSVFHDTLLAVAAPQEEATDVGRTASRGTDRVIGLDLRRDGLLSLELEPPDATWSFGGPPICADGRLFVAMRREEVQAQLYVGCFSAATGRLLWKTAVCSTQASAELGAAPRGGDLLTLGGSAVFFNTNVGVVAALEQRSGEIRWLRRYPRGGVGGDNNRAVVVHRRETPCLYHRSAVVVAPADAAAVFALDASTGATLWVTDEPYDVEHLIAAVDNTLVASGRRLWMLDVATGEVRRRWPDSVAAGVHGTGRGCIAGKEVFWPTRDAIYVFDITTGGQSRLPMDRSMLGAGDLNLVAVDGNLILAGQDKLAAWGAESASHAAEPLQSQIPNSKHFAAE